MTDLEISKALALAIGWKPEEMILDGDKLVMYRTHRNSYDQLLWFYQVFDYRDEVVAFRIAERYDAFPLQSCKDDKWHSSFEGDDTAMFYADTPQKAIALAVINGVMK